MTAQHVVNLEFIVAVEFSSNTAAFFIFHFVHSGCHTAHAVRCEEHALQPYS